MSLKKFFKGMFSETADVDYFPRESQRLRETTTTRTTTSTTTTTISNTGSDFDDTGFISLKEEEQQHQRMSDIRPGLTDGFESWTQSYDAVHQGIFHIILYFTVGVVAYSFLLNTQWPIIDSLYFSVVIFTTVGYGDLCPTSGQGEIFTIFFALYGIAILGIFLGILGDMMVERQQKQHKDTMENARRKYLQMFQHGTYQPGNHPRSAPIDEDGSTEETVFRKIKKGLKTYVDIILHQKWAMLVLVAIAIPIILVEQWDIVKGVYWMVITGTTIGLGDETPTHPLSKGLCILYIPLSVYSVGRFLGLIATTFLDRRSSMAEEKFLNRALTLSDIKRMDLDNQGEVSREEFLVYMLVTLQKVDEEDINEIISVFQKLDKTGDGVLTSEDLVAGIKRTKDLSSSSSTDSSTRF